MRNLRGVFLLIVILIAGRVVAQKAGLDPERIKLQFLVGSYTTVTNISPMPSAPNGAVGKGTSVITWGLDSMFLVIDEQSMNSLFGQYKGHGLLGFDAPTNQFVLSMFNNAGDHPSYKGNFVGDTLVLETKVPMPGKPFDQKLVWCKDGEAVKLRVLNDFGNGFVPVLDQTYVPVSQRTK